MSLGIRKIVTYAEDIFIEGGRVGGPVRMAGVAAVIANPWAGPGFVDNLRPKILSIAPALAQKMVPILLDMCGGGDKVEGIGKAAIVGTAGEIEHGSGLIHTLRFGNIFREAVGGKSYLSFTNVRGAPGSALLIPMMDKNDEGRRSHYLTLAFNISDAPGPDEIVIAIGASTGGRLHSRIGDRYQDMKEMTVAETAPA
jgi:hypothetical protein